MTFSQGIWGFRGLGWLVVRMHAPTMSHNGDVVEALVLDRDLMYW